MKEQNFEKELQTAKRIALETWALIAPFYDSRVEVEKKKDGSPVTKADKLASKLIIEGISKEFPKDSIVSEEDKPIFNGGRTWYIDPIDGTKGFIKRNGHFAIHIGFCVQSTPVLGVVYWPIVEDLYYGSIRSGSFRVNPRGKLELKFANPNRSDLVASTNGDFPYNDLKPIFRELGVKEFHNCGSEGLRLMKLAENRADIRISEYIGGNTWDLCAPHAILNSMGCITNYVDGKPIIYKGQSVLGKRYISTFSQELMNKAVELSKHLN